MHKSSLLRAIAVALGAAACAPATGADAWPTKTVRFVVPFAPGGSSDVVARSVAAELTKALGQSVYVENKPGGAGNVAMQDVAKATDDHTIILGHIGTLAVNPFMFEKLPYDAARDFVPITLLAKVPSLYLVPPTSPVKDLREFIAYARKNPGKLNYGSAGNGSAGHLAMEYLKAQANIFVTHVPYRGTGPQLIDLMAGRLDAASVGVAAVIQNIRTGKLRAIATGTTTRLPQLPDVGTVAEQGLPGFEMTQWYGIIAPATMSAPARQRLAVEAAKAVQTAAVRERLAADAAIAVGSTPEEFAKFIAAEQKRWKPVIDRAKIKPD
jgi:tripartite-type tricarboxylate transporter receptor subunit TctC